MQPSMAGFERRDRVPSKATPKDRCTMPTHARQRMCVGQAVLAHTKQPKRRLRLHRPHLGPDDERLSPPLLLLTPPIASVCVGPLVRTHKIKQTSITPPSINTQGDSHDCLLIQAEVDFPAT